MKIIHPPKPSMLSRDSALDSIPDQPPRAPKPAVLAAWGLMSAALIMALLLHLLSALLAGLLVYELVGLMAPPIARHLPGERSRYVAVLLLGALSISGISFAVLGLVAFFHSDVGSLSVLLAKLASITDGARAVVPASISAYLPADASAIKQGISAWLRAHGVALQLAGTELGRFIVRVLLGMVIGAMLAIKASGNDTPVRPLALALHERVSRLHLSFSRIVRAQVRIASINTAITSVYLLLILPLVGVHLPLTKTMITLTFIAGLLPVIGNLISNTIILIISLSHSLSVALASLIFLLLIHKLEYFLNARIVGGKIHAKAWELLVAMLIMEAAFGIAGLVAAPIYYAWLKDELGAQGWI